MSEKHTPGPWRLKVGGNFGNCIEAFSGKRVDELDDGFRTLCTYQPCEPTGKRDAEDANALANARLIAAAPELLDALRHTAAVCAGDITTKNGLINALEKARSALKKAQGEV